MNKIGSVSIPNKIVLAPMAGVNDIAFRQLCKRYGAGLIYTEMVNANAISRANKATYRRFEFSESEKPIAVQLFGAKKDCIIDAAKFIESSGADIIDFNLGCADVKVMQQGAGAALLKRPAKIGELISAIVEAVKIPVTAKIRLGVKKNQGIEFAKIIEKAGASAIAVHARTAEQFYSGKADWNAIKEIKENVSIPVIGNGDIVKPEDAKRMLDETGCDFVMIGRAAIGNPMIFRQINDYLKTGKYEKVSAKQRIDCFFEFLKLAEKHKVKYDAVKRHALAFTKGLPNAAKFRFALSKVKDKEGIIVIVEDFKKRLLL
jgi:tRNA-dihydrouridine synthase B